MIIIIIKASFPTYLNDLCLLFSYLKQGKTLKEIAAEGKNEIDIQATASYRTIEVIVWGGHVYGN